MDRSNDRDAYLGTWILEPELCIYEEGQPPLSGFYRISQRDSEVLVSIDWAASDGSTHQIEFHAPADGQRQPSSTPGVSHLSITRVGRSILDSSAYAGADEVAYARRIASQDGLLLATVQVGRRADGTSFRNFQVYRRQSADA